jgi:hypothetical protein
MAQSMELSPDLSGSLRRHPESPNFWLAVLAGSLVVHLVFLLSGRWLVVRVAPVRSERPSTPIELVDLPPKLSGKPSQGVSLTASKVTSAPIENSSRAASSTQLSEPTKPAIVPPYSPQPIQEQRPLADNSKKSPTQPPSVPRKPTPAPSTPPEPASENTASPENTEPPASSQPLEGENNSPNPQPSNPGQPNPLPSSGDQNNLPNPSQPSTDGTQPNPGQPPPSLPGPIGSGQPLPSTEVTIAAQVTGKIERADLSKNDSQAKTAQLRGNTQQQITIPYSPDFELSPGQTLNLKVRFVVDTTSGQVINSSVPVNPTSMSDAGLDRLVSKVFEPLLFDVTFDTAAVNKAQLTEWFVPVQIQVVK